MGAFHYILLPILTIIACVVPSTKSFAQRHASAPVGVAYYALSAFSDTQCNKALSVFDGVKTPSLAILWGTFGSSTACLRRYLAAHSNVPRVLEIHITNNTCLRKKICKRGEIHQNISWREYNQLLEKNDPETISRLRKRIYKIAKTLRSIRQPGTRLRLRLS